MVQIIMIPLNVLEKVRDSNITLKIDSLELILEPIIRDLFDKMIKRQNEQMPLMTIAELAERFKVTKTTIQNWIRRGTITGSKIGKNRYFTYDEVNKALASHGWKIDLHR